MIGHVRLHDAANIIPWTNRTSMPQVSIHFPTALDLIPHRVLSTFSEWHRLRAQPRPVIAWHALEHEATLNPVPALLMVCIAVVMLLISRHMRRVPLAMRHWMKDPLGYHGRQEHLQRTQDKYRYSVEKLLKVAHRCRTLQVQLKEKDDRINSHSVALESTARDLEFYEAENEQLKAENYALTTLTQSLKADKATIEQRAVEQYYEHARQLHDSEREQESLERVIQFFETEQASLTSKHNILVDRLEQENHHLRQQVEEQSALLIAQRHASSVRLSEVEDQLQASKDANALLQGQLLEQADEQAHSQEILHEELCSVRSRFEESLSRLERENASLKQQLVEQQKEFTTQRDILLDRLSLAQADQSEVKAKLKRVQDDFEQLKSADVARLATQTSRSDDRCVDLRSSMAEDLSFVYVESQCQRDMYENQLSFAEAEITSLRDQLAKCIKRYERQCSRLVRAQASMRDATNDHDRLASKVQALEAHKKVSDDLEHMLSDAIHKHEEKYETLEISFDVLEAAYSFLAAELVRTEHRLKDALSVQKQLWQRLHVHEPDCQPLPEIEELEEEVDAATEAEEVLEEDHDTEIESEADERRVTLSRTSTAMSMSTASDRSWPATPGLSMYSATTSSRSPPSSPIVLTPPLPALMLPSVPPSEGCPSAYPHSEPEDVFGSWSMLDGRSREST